MLGYLAIYGGLCLTCFINSFHQRTPLLMAAIGGHVDTVRCLVENDAVINIKDKNGASE